nr:D-alanyl-lipoteichoic acid biosynthesis protein DltD [Pseudanabaena sp. 'Roaring Creek']
MDITSLDANPLDAKSLDAKSLDAKSLDANPLMPLTSIDAITDSAPNVAIHPEQSPSSLEYRSANDRLSENRLSENRLSENRLNQKSLALVNETKGILTEELAGIELSHTKQKGDCLYLYSQDREVNCATRILEAIAPSTQDLASSVLFAEGIRRLKLHGNAWALGLDLPISDGAIVAAEIIANLLATFRHDQQPPKLAQAKLKLLLQDNCLNLLCETKINILQAEMALPILNALRAVRAAEYFQAVTVSSRVIGTKKPSWSFEIDLLAIGTQNPQLEIIEEDNSLTLDNPDQEEVSDEESRNPSFSDRLNARLMGVGRMVFGLKWLGQTTPQTNPKTTPQMLSLPTCIASFAIGLGLTIALDRTLSRYEPPDPSIKFAIADTKIDVQGDRTASAPAKETANKPALNFNIALFNEKLALLDWQTTNKRRSPDILIVGSSRALRGIEPHVLEKALINRGFKDISVFNLGIDGATAKVVNLQITQILARPQLPRAIVWADGLRAFNSSRSDITYDEITASSGYKQLQESLKASGLNSEPLSNQSVAIAKSLNPISQSLDALFTTLPKKQEIRTSLVKKFDRNTHMLSNSEALIASTLPSTATALDSKGFVSFDVTFDPNTYFQKFPQVPGDYDLDYRNFDITGSQFEAFANVVDFCRRNDIELIVVNMPLHATYLDSIRTRYEATFNERMQELALRESFTYLDLSHQIQNQAELFSDPSHLNKKGAIAISQLLAQNPKISWQNILNNKPKR